MFNFFRKKFPCQALWQNKDYDAEVTIVGIYGEHEGVLYYKAESGTGIPAKELKFNVKKNRTTVPIPKARR